MLAAVDGLHTFTRFGPSGGGACSAQRLREGGRSEHVSNYLMALTYGALGERTKLLHTLRRRVKA